MTTPITRDSSGMFRTWITVQGIPKLLQDYTYHGLRERIRREEEKTPNPTGFIRRLVTA